MTPREEVLQHAALCRKALEEGKPRPKYEGANLSGANLSVADLRGADLRRADLSVADLRGADLRGAYLYGAELREAYLSGAYLRGADLRGAYLSGADLSGADLSGADLHGANLREANLSGATLPCGVKFEDYKKDPLAGLCKEPEARKRAVAAWGNHKWTNCPMHEGLGISRVEEAPENIRLNVAAFVALFDAKLLPVPGLR